MLELEIKKNPERAPNFGKTYGQNVEPEGTYVTKNGGFVPEGWFEGKAFLNNPLFIDIDDNSLVKWKNELADKMKAKGSKLTNKLISKGYDAIITKYSDGGYGEIILFPNAKFYLNKKEMKESRINSLMETYKLVSEDDLDEIAYIPSKKIDEKSNAYLLDQAKQGLIRVKGKSSEPNENKIKYELNLEYPNEIVNLYGGVYLVVLYSNQEFSNIEDINIVFMVRYENYRDGIRIQYTGSTPDARGKSLAIKIYIALKEKFGLPIYSDFSQTSFSRYRIWENLYNKSPNSVKAYDINKNQKFDIIMKPNQKGVNEMFYIDEDVDIKDYKNAAKNLGINWDKDWDKGSRMNWDNVPNDIQEKIIEYSKYKPVYTKKDNQVLLVYI